MQKFADPSNRCHKAQKVHHELPDNTNQDPAERVCKESIQFEAPRHDQLPPTSQETTDQRNPRSDPKFCDLIGLMEHIDSETTVWDLRNCEAFGDLRAALGDQNVSTSTFSFSGPSTFASEPIRYAEASELSAPPPRRFYRTFWRAMARKALICSEMAKRSTE
jgi:hypothetical protein